LFLTSFFCPLLFAFLSFCMFFLLHSNFLILKKIIVGLWDHLAVSVSVSVCVALTSWINGTRRDGGC
jgi:hypothetical protein